MRSSESLPSNLADFTTTPRVLFPSAMAVGLGVLGAFVALALLRLIGLCTNLFFYQRLGTALVSPAGHHLGALVIAVPVIGALMVGVMARYGSERIRGHGIPEAIEAILIHGSRVQPRVAFLKPLSSAISIGSGGPFGAEGPIIMTGGAFGSVIAQFCHLTSAERKTLMVAGAAAGMSATFAAPVASVLLAVEVLLFEWKPRSLIPVAVASATAAAARCYLLGVAPLFPVPAHAAFVGVTGLLGCVLAGLLAGAASVLLTYAVYGFEDAFHRLPIHWMWWPALGGLVVGVGGWFFPHALGVGYDVIGQMLQGSAPLNVIVGMLVVKSVIWSVALGSGTSGGVLAPLLLVGGALGGVEAHFLPSEGAGFWPLVSMAAVLGGTMRSPLMAVVFAFELTHDANALLPLLVTVSLAYACTVLVMKRSILTEKVSRRGYHMSCEYAVDPLEVLLVREAMRSEIVALPLALSEADLRERVRGTTALQRLYPVVDEGGSLLGVVPRSAMGKVGRDGRVDLSPWLIRDPVVAYPDESMRDVVHRMAECGVTRMPVLERGIERRLGGMIALQDLLKARSHLLEAERRREVVLPLRALVPFARPKSGVDVAAAEESPRRG